MQYFLSEPLWQVSTVRYYILLWIHWFLCSCFRKVQVIHLFWKCTEQLIQREFEIVASARINLCVDAYLRDRTTKIHNLHSIHPLVDLINQDKLYLFFFACIFAYLMWSLFSNRLMPLSLVNAYNWKTCLWDTGIPSFPNADGKLRCKRLCS